MYQKGKSILLILMLACFSVVPAFSNDRTELEQSIDELVLAIEHVANSLAGQTKIEPVDYKNLKKMLPGKFRGFKQVGINGERKSMFGFRISLAEAEYEGKGESHIEMSIIDFGSVKGIAGKAMLAWMSSEIDNESDHAMKKQQNTRGTRALKNILLRIRRASYPSLWSSDF